jgi:hypothetical protein
METINLENDLCIICLEFLDNNIKRPMHCNCKIILHDKCLDNVNKNGLLCPICRKKNQLVVSNIYSQNIAQNQINMFLSNLWFFPQINSTFLFMCYIWPFNILLSIIIILLFFYIIYIFYYYAQFRFYILTVLFYIDDFFT